MQVWNMRSSHHLLISVAGAVGMAVVLDSPSPVMIGSTAVAVGVGIDFDHFIVARYNVGDWRALRGLLAHPSMAILDQDAIFQPTEVWPLHRLLTHTVVGGLVVAGLLPVDAVLALVAAVTVYLHVLADLLWDNRRWETYLQRAAEHANG
jgi:hypothetical protein